MDCEKFDQHVIDALYDELDELTMASVKRHMEGCSRCASAFSALRATREVAILPLEEPSEELESRILFAASAAQRKTPWHRKALRALAWAGSHAMRPQLAMAAVFVLVIGSSLLLLRAKPGTTPIGPVSVTERGEPSPDRDEGAAPMAAPTSAAQAVAAADQPPPPAAAEAAPARGDGKDSGQDREKQEESKGAKAGDAQSALADAKATESASGCDAALPKYEDVGVRYPGTTQATAAMWAAAACHKKNGNADRAKELYGVLAKRDEYKEKAEEALNELSPMSNMGTQSKAVASAAPAATATQAPGGGGHAGAAAPAKAPAAAPKAASPAKPAPNAMEYPADPQAPGGAGSRGNAAPIRRRAIDSAF